VDGLALGVRMRRNFEPMRRQVESLDEKWTWGSRCAAYTSWAERLHAPRLLSGWARSGPEVRLEEARCRDLRQCADLLEARLGIITLGRGSLSVFIGWYPVTKRSEPPIPDLRLICLDAVRTDQCCHLFKRENSCYVASK
jgi:hypothetical protein